MCFEPMKPYAKWFFWNFHFYPFFGAKNSQNWPKMTFLHKVLGTFSLKPLMDMFMILNGNYGTCLEAHSRELNILVFLALFWGSKGQKLIFIDCGIYYHVIPQNVLLSSQKNNELVCFSEFSIFGPFYFHFRSKFTPKFSQKYGGYFYW